ncbi:hypothetical protein M758_9G097100 [Ceratodon purpureus]|nr:hypothetical protein M758_9G097100 [Ceratodon purpureus]
MMEEALGWAGDGLPPGALVMIKDCVAAKGGFFLTFFLKRLLVPSNVASGRSKVVFVGMAEPFSHYGRIAKKQGCNLIQARDNGQFLFLDMMAAGNHLTSERRREQAVSPLQRLYQIVNESVKRMQTGNENDRVVIMVDDASLLEVSAGGRSDQVLAFLQYCRAINSGHNRCSVVVLVHGDTDITYGAAGLDNGGYVEHGEQRVASLAHELDHIADVVISVDPLSTGLANDVHGQVTVVHWSDVLSNRESRKGIQTLQFKLMENNTTFFHPGGRF